MNEQTIPTPTTKPKTIDINKLVKKEKHRAYHAGRIHSLRDLVNNFNPLMSADLLECIINQLDHLTQSSQELTDEIREMVDALPNAPVPDRMPSNPFYKSPIADLPFMQERMKEQDEKLLTPETKESLDAVFKDDKDK